VESAKVSVRFDADDPRAALEKFVGIWRPVCLSPCEGELSRDGSYRIGGDGIRPSEPFGLPEGTAKVKVRASVGTDGRGVGGGFLAIGGGVVAYVGAMVFLFSLVPTSDSSSSISSSGRSSARTVGAVMMIGGVGAGIGGLIMLLNNKTDVDVSAASSVARGTRLKLFGSLELGPQGILF
jgi:hypothetical protein